MNSTGKRIPVALLTGFLGSGKTTILNRWLRDPALSNAAVIVNEFGDIGIDHTLIASSTDNTIELSTGCLCCTVQGDLVDTLRDLLDKRARGLISAFDRVVIETTGMADPGPVLQALMTFPVANGYRLAQVITTIDAVNGLTTLNGFVEAQKQAAIADQLIITKLDLVRDSSALESRLTELNPTADISQVRRDSAPCLDVMSDLDIREPGTSIPAARRWLNVDAHGEGRYRPVSSPEHTSGIQSFCLVFEQPFIWQELAAWLDALVIAHGPDLLRVKGIVAVEGQSRPIVVHAVQQLFHPPAPLEQWPYEDRHSRLVFITRNLSQAYIEAVFDVIRGKRLSSATAACSCAIPLHSSTASASL